MPSLGLSLRNLYETFAISFPTLVEAAQGRVTKEVCDARLAGWSRHVVENARIELEVRGRANLESDTYIVMSNHQSLYDVPVLFHVIGGNLRMITKKELFAVPVFGPALAVGGFISIDRNDRAGAIESLRVARETLAAGTHVWISPEGTRSRTGELLSFKKGGFHLALEAGLPLLPVTLTGTRDVLAAKGVRSTAGQRVVVTFHRPLRPEPYQAMGKTGRDALMCDVRAAMASAL